ncbi:MAG: glycosyltransferase [Clostridia bacterium]|nr:glycosyltransferase [Clostridia bacterium]
MKYSILVPVYNVEKYLEQCVDSLLSQTFKGEYEIILVDDGSTDSSGLICDKYAEKNPQKIKAIHKKNEGLVSAREWGIKNADGNFCLFVDSDDFAEENLLECVDLCIKKHPDADMVIYSFEYFENSIKKPRPVIISDGEKVFGSDNKKELYDMLIVGNLVTALWIKAVKTEILKNDPADYTAYYDKNMAEDMFRSVHLLTAAEKIIYINEPLYNYRTNNESISKSFSPDTIPKKNILYVYDRIREYLPVWGMDTAEVIDKLNSRWFNETMTTFSNYYKNAKTKREKRQILEFDWKTMLPMQAVYEKGSQESKLFRKWFECLENKKYFPVKLFFFKEKIRKLFKKIRSKVKGK